MDSFRSSKRRSPDRCEELTAENKRHVAEVGLWLFFHGLSSGLCATPWDNTSRLDEKTGWEHRLDRLTGGTQAMFIHFWVHAMRFLWFLGVFMDHHFDELWVSPKCRQSGQQNSWMILLAPSIHESVVSVHMWTFRSETLRNGETAPSWRFHGSYSRPQTAVSDVTFWTREQWKLQAQQARPRKAKEVAPTGQRGSMSP